MWLFSLSYVEVHVNIFYVTNDGRQRRPTTADDVKYLLRHIQISRIANMPHKRFEL